MPHALFPYLIFVPKQFGKSNSGVYGGLGLISQRHSSFYGSSIALTRVAPFASSHHVVPSMRAALRSRHDVIQRQMPVATAVLARMSVAAQNFPAVDRGDFPQEFPVTTSQVALFGYVY